MRLSEIVVVSQTLCCFGKADLIRVTQVSALSGGFYPGALYMDPEFGKPTDRPQMWMFLGALVVNWIGYFVGRGSLG